MISAIRLQNLKKENAELKNERNAFKIYSDGAELDAINLNEQLTKAKEIIKYLLSFIQKENYKTRWDINIAEAEQFLKKVEK